MKKLVFLTFSLILLASSTNFMYGQSTTIPIYPPPVFYPTNISAYVNFENDICSTTSTLWCVITDRGPGMIYDQPNGMGIVGSVVMEGPSIFNKTVTLAPHAQSSMYAGSLDNTGHSYTIYAGKGVREFGAPGAPVRNAVSKTIYLDKSLKSKNIIIRNTESILTVGFPEIIVTDK